MKQDRLDQCVSEYVHTKEDHRLVQVRVPKSELSLIEKCKKIYGPNISWQNFIMSCFRLALLEKGLIKKDGDK